MPTLLLTGSVAWAQAVAFDDVDINGDGWLDAAELLTVFDVAGLSLMSEDRNGDGVLSRKELRPDTPASDRPRSRVAYAAEAGARPERARTFVGAQGADPAPANAAGTVATSESADADAGQDSGGEFGEGAETSDGGVEQSPSASEGDDQSGGTDKGSSEGAGQDQSTEGGQDQSEDGRQDRSDDADAESGAGSESDAGEDSSGSDGQNESPDDGLGSGD